MRDLKNKLRSYYLLAKPGIIYGNLLAATGGFFLASRGEINLWLYVAMLLGTSFIIASACVFNNFIDRDIDEKMARTRTRALVTKVVSVRSALIYGTILGVIGVCILGLYTNLLTLLIGLIGFVTYVFLYTYAKRITVHGTLIGTIPGATPPVAGYCAVTNQFDFAALLLFLILVFWQMPHFYAIAIYRMHDYDAAAIPVLPLKRGIPLTKIQILFYIVAFIMASLLLSTFGYTGIVYFVVMALLGIVWFWQGLVGFTTENNIRWARKLFRFSLITLLAFSLLLSLDTILP